MIYKNSWVFIDNGIYTVYDHERNKQVFTSLTDAQEFINDNL